MRLVAGLGNPGEKYKFTRHNTGFLAIDKLCEKYNIDLNKKYKKSIIGFGNIAGEDVILIKPLTYMNLSGTIIHDVLLNWKIKFNNLIVIYDDIALNLGTIRIREQGSSAGHKGIESIINELKTEKFIRMRIGIGPKPVEMKSEEFVLSNFLKEEFEILKKVLELIPEAIEVIIKDSVSSAMTIFNRKKFDGE